MNRPLAAPPSPRLSAAQVEHYRREGYVLPREPVFPNADFRELQATFERLLADWTARGGRPEAMDVPHFYNPELMRWLLHPAVLDLVEPITGPDIVLFSSHFICKPAGDGRRVPWHEDSAYWRGQWDPMDVVTVWLAVDGSDLENGCMHVVPRTHHDGYSEYADLSEKAVFHNEIKAGTFDAAKAVPCILQPNQASLHHAKAIHGSAANTSSRRRCGYTMRYISAKARFNAERDPANRFQIYLARGQDRAGNTYADPAKANQRWIDHYGVNPPKGH
jgi:ectoine hydroxylase-related dioxygenase (phytanoyl-CoA dioxygenase family)